MRERYVVGQLTTILEFVHPLRECHILCIHLSYLKRNIIAYRFRIARRGMPILQQRRTRQTGARLPHVNVSGPPMTRTQRHCSIETFKFGFFRL